MPTTIDIHDSSIDLPKLVELTKEGREVILADGVLPVARLVGIESTSAKKPRTAGLHQGSMWISDDFDEPLPDGFWLGQS